MTEKRTIRVKQLTRVEGDGGLVVTIKDGRVAQAAFTVTEPPRLFEAFLRGRRYSEVPDITARICGICPLAYMLSACQAMENGFGLTVDASSTNLRRLVFLGEWIASHSLHVYLLHAPDFFGLPDALSLASQYPDIVRRGLRLKQIGNAIVRCVGGRAVHPVNLRVGGFYRYPSRQDLLALSDDLEWALDAARATVDWTAAFSFPEFDRDYTFMALSHPTHYALLEGRLQTSTGAALAIGDFESHVQEQQVAHSTALHAFSREDGAYLVGPLARFNLNFDQLSPAARSAAQSVGLMPSCTNPFKSIVVRSVEIVHACEEALELIHRDYATEPAPVAVTPLAGTGYGCTEAPRGVCWHRYRMDEEGTVLDARIIAPTSQNQAIIESDLRAFADAHCNLPPDQLQRRCELVVRNHDPCISCSCHIMDTTGYGAGAS